MTNVKLKTKTAGFLLLVITTLFLVGLMLFSMEGLRTVTEARIADCQQQIADLKTELESTTDPAETKKLTGRLITLEGTDGNGGRLEMLKNKSTYYMIGMMMIILFVLFMTIYIHLRNAPFAGPTAALAILTGIGITYQFIFTFELANVIGLALALGAGCTAYLFWRRINTVGNTTYYLLALAALLLMAANVLFGVVSHGARLWIRLGGFSIQPGEVVKPLLILLAALAYKKKERIVTYVIVCILCCATLVLLRDLGTAIIIFAVFLFMIYSLMDFKVSLVCMLVALVGVIGASMTFDYVRIRFTNLGTAMLPNSAAEQQTKVLESILFGGVNGLGFEQSTYMINDFSVTSDTALAGILAIFGLGMFLIVILCYAVLAILPNRNAPLYPASENITMQISILLVVQVVLNFFGAIDVLPFSGLVCPMVSEGNSALLTFGILFGLEFAALNPLLKRSERKYASQ